MSSLWKLNPEGLSLHTSQMAPCQANQHLSSNNVCVCVCVLTWNLGWCVIRWIMWNSPPPNLLMNFGYFRLGDKLMNFIFCSWTKIHGQIWREIFPYLQLLIYIDHKTKISTRILKKKNVGRDCNARKKNKFRHFI